ncbi:DUF4214 domain-containing protein [Rhizobium lemnae]|uniref:DUF4214 domain-containing protein n=1 Tax=Rhizobium lemnae TaxID=1214924 RepID=A0ABV8E873_9HYPH|nr:DUF4214 domain-containing protein [Rhizobium lemnae]
MGIRNPLSILINGLKTACVEAEETAPIETAAAPAEVHQVKPSADTVEGPKLNLGSGHDNKVGWINVDMHERHSPDIVADVTKLVTIGDNYAAYALAQDVLEHVSRDTVLTALHEWNRVLRHDGLLEVRTTDVIAITDLMRQPERDNPEEHNRLLQCIFGTQGYVGDFHLSGFTETWMRDALEKAGFEVVYFGRHDQWLLDVVARKVSHSPPDRLITEGTNEEFIEAAYSTILKREPDDDGRAYWLSQLADGITREYIVRHFRDTNERASGND